MAKRKKCNFSHTVFFTTIPNSENSAVSSASCSCRVVLGINRISCSKCKPKVLEIHYMHLKLEKLEFTLTACAWISQFSLCLWGQIVCYIISEICNKMLLYNSLNFITYCGICKMKTINQLMSYQCSFWKNEQNQNTFQYCYCNNSSLSRPREDSTVTYIL